MTLSGVNASLDLVATPDLLAVSGTVIFAGLGVRDVEISFVPGNVLMSIVKATSGANGYYSALVPPSSYTVEIDQYSTPVGGEKYVFDQAATFVPSGSGVTFDIEPVKKVEMYGNLLGASTELQLRLSGPESVKVYCPVSGLSETVKKGLPPALPVSVFVAALKL
jgi:xanthine/uracil/vitamin C permease (AzgA family)